MAKEFKPEQKVLLEFINTYIGTMQGFLFHMKNNDLGALQAGITAMQDSLNNFKDYVKDTRNLPAHII